MRLDPLGELTPARFAEIGRPTRLGRSRDGRLVALASAFHPLYWPGRVFYSGQLMRFRVSLYSSDSAGDFARRLAIFYGAQYPIHDIAFHPYSPWLALATGAYDGGYLFEGELLMWNWETGERRNLFGESREAVRCRFLDDGRLAVLLRPRDEDEYAGRDPFTTFVGLVLAETPDRAELGLASGEPDPRLAALAPIDPAQLGFQAPAAVLAPDALAPEDRAALDRLGFEERHRIWDVAWLDDARAAVVHDNCQVEVWRVEAAGDGGSGFGGVLGTREVSLRGPGYGLQLLRQPERMLVHVNEREIWHQSGRSVLYTLEGDSLRLWRRFENEYAFSVDCHGRILARDTRARAERDDAVDLVLAPSGETVLEADLGAYDALNHYVRVDGGDGLYFLRGAPGESYRDKRLCRVDGAGAIAERMAWDGEGEQLTQGCAAWAGDAAIVRAYRVYGRGGPRRADIGVELYSLAEGRACWRRRTDAGVIALAVAANGDVVFASIDGRLGVLDGRDGRLVAEVHVEADGVPTVATALAIRGDRVLAGTLDAHLLLFALSPVPFSA